MSPRDFSLSPVLEHDGATTFQPVPGAVSVMLDGKVGIGTTNLTETLDVAGNIHASGKVLASAYSSNSPFIMEAPATKERARIDDVTGNFGIGTQTPAHRLHVHGGAIFITATNNDIPGLGGPMLLFGGGTPADANGRWGIEYDPNAGGLNFWKPSPNPAGFGNYFLFLANNGRVGLGTATPNDQLEITGNFRLPPSTTTTGAIMSGGDLFIHRFGANNFFAGVNAGNLTTSGTGQNTGVGVNALKAIVKGQSNTAVGYSALASTTSGAFNTAIGPAALSSNTTGVGNTAIGPSALQSNTVGGFNTAVGSNALLAGTGINNTAVGSNALTNNTGANNTAVGQAALLGNVMGNGNTAIGFASLMANTTGTNNTAIGYRTSVSAANLTNATAIGAGAVVSADNSLVLGGTGGNAVKVGIGTAIPRAEMDVVGTGAIIVPVGTTAQRPAKPVSGMIRFNSSTKKFEGYDGTGWQNLN